MREPDEGLLHAWLDGELDADEAREVEQLVAREPAWAVKLAEARALRAASADLLKVLEPPVHVRQAAAVPAPPPSARRWLRSAAWAATLVVAAGIGYLARGDAAAERDAESAPVPAVAVAPPRTAPQLPPTVPPSAPIAPPAAGPVASAPAAAPRPTLPRGHAPAPPPSAPPAPMMHAEEPEARNVADAAARLERAADASALEARTSARRAEDEPVARAEAAPPLPGWETSGWSTSRDGSEVALYTGADGQTLQLVRERVPAPEPAPSDLKGAEAAGAAAGAGMESGAPQTKATSRQARAAVAMPVPQRPAALPETWRAGGRQYRLAGTLAPDSLRRLAAALAAATGTPPSRPSPR